MSELKEIIDLLTPNELVKTFEWGSLNFTSCTLELTEAVHVITIYKDMMNLMDTFAMMTEEVPFCVVGQNELQFFSTWGFKNKKSANNLVISVIHAL